MNIGSIFTKGSMMKRTARIVKSMKHVVVDRNETDIPRKIIS